jgi:hypothetical protein
MVLHALSVTLHLLRLIQKYSVMMRHTMHTHARVCCACAQCETIQHGAESTCCDVTCMEDRYKRATGHMQRRRAPR